MRATSEHVAAAETHLSQVEPRSAALIERHGPCPIGPTRARASHFEFLARAIIFQQLAGRAAATIYDRFRLRVPGRVTPESVLAVPDSELRAAGLSDAKTRSVRDLAQRVAEGEVPLRRVGRFPDATVVERLTLVRGIGPWTAEMFLMFQLGRIDVWPAGDLGVRRGYALLTGNPEPSERQMPEAGAPFAPYRSVAAWYCWRAVETVTPG